MEDGPVSAVPTRDERATAYRRIWRDFWIGLAFALLLVLGNIAFERSGMGEQFQRWGDQIFQRSLQLEALPDVVVLDIHGIATEKNPAGEKFNEPTLVDRHALHDLVYAVANLQPRSIGIDVDMSPRNFGYADRNSDPWFFSEMLRLEREQHVPVYVAVYKSSSAPPDLWLASPLYKDLAANASLFPEDNDRTVPQSLGTGSHCGPSLSAAVAGIPLKCDTHSGFFTFAEPATMWNRGQFVGQEYAVNYSALQALQLMDLNAPVPSAVQYQGNKISGKAVLLGDVGPNEQDSDQCDIPVGNAPITKGATVPCVFVHASGAFTLMQARLYRLTPQARVIVDMLLAAAVLGGVAALRLYYASRTRARVATERLYNAGFIALAVGILLICGFLSRMTHIVWDDYVLVVVALLLHTSLERWLGRLFAWARANLPKFVFEEQTP